MPARVEKFRHRAGLRVYAGEICAFVEVAVDTGECDVVAVIVAAMRLRDNVLKVKWHQRKIILAELAVLAVVPGTTSYAGFGCRVHLLRVAAIRCRAWR